MVSERCQVVRLWKTTSKMKNNDYETVYRVDMNIR